MTKRTLSSVLSVAWLLTALLPVRPALAYTEEECDKIGTCQVGKCSTGLNEVGTCSDNTFQTTCCSPQTIQAGQSDLPSCDLDSATGCCKTTEKPATDQAGELVREDCPDRTSFHTADCYCLTPGGVHAKIAFGPYSYKACMDKCTPSFFSAFPPSGTKIDSTQGIGLSIYADEPKASAKAGTSGAPTASFGSAATTAAQQQAINSLCFTQDECASKDYGGSNDAFVPDSSCPSGKGRCRAPEPSIGLTSPVLGVSEVTGIRGYVDLMFRYMLSIVVLAATIMFIYGGFKYILGSTITSISTAKETMINSVIGLVLSFGAITLLNTLNPATTKFTPLTIWLIKKEAFTDLEWCKDFKPEQGKTLLFASAGDPPGSTLYDNAQFTVAVDDAECGKKYYPQGFAASTCDGSSCKAMGGGFTCIKCDAANKPEDCGDRTEGKACGIDPFSGTLTYAEEIVYKLVPVIVCNWAQAEKSDITLANVNSYESIEAQFDSTLNTVTLSGSSKYHLAIDGDLIKAGTDFCSNEKNGGLRGFVLGAEYAHGRSIISTATKGTVGGFFSDLAHNTAADLGKRSYLLITKSQCINNGGSGKYTGYSDGAPIMRLGLGEAFWCANLRFTSSIFKDNLWSASELEQAIKGEHALTCDLSFSVDNAPENPSTTAYTPACNINTPK